jgi:flagellar biosynthesis anti-sigma factor FlgM
MIDKILSNTPTGYTSSTSSVDSKFIRSLPETREVNDVSTEVQVSDEAQVLQRLMQAVRNTPDVRQDVVDDMREKISSGEYQVNVDALAEQLVQFVQ